MEAGAGSTRVLRPMLLYLYPMECGFGVCRIWRGWGKKTSVLFGVFIVKRGGLSGALGFRFIEFIEGFRMTNVGLQRRLRIE